MNLRIKVLKIFPYLLAFKELLLLRVSTNSPYKVKPAIGFMRGIDFYSTFHLYRLLANEMMNFKQVHGVYPSINNPRGFNQKIFWFKFLGEIKVPEAGNKMLTHYFIPDNLKKFINCPEIIWHSSSPNLPQNHEIPSATYYLKSSHGSGMVKKIEYPLDSKTRRELEVLCSQWLKTPYGLESSEWWYNSFKPVLLIEKSVSESDSITYGLFMFSGELSFISMVKKLESHIEISWLDTNLEMLEDQPEGIKQVTDYVLPKNFNSAIELCREISSPYPFVRVDLLVDTDNNFYLGEMTFSPGNALSKRPIKMDLALGELWKIPI